MVDKSGYSMVVRLDKPLAGVLDWMMVAWKVERTASETDYSMAAKWDVTMAV